MAALYDSEIRGVRGDVFAGGVGGVRRALVELAGTIAPARLDLDRNDHRGAGHADVETVDERSHARAVVGPANPERIDLAVRRVVERRRSVARIPCRKPGRVAGGIMTVHD